MIGRGSDWEGEEVDGDVGGGEEREDTEGEGSRVPHGNFPDVTHGGRVCASIGAVEEGFDEVTDNT